MGNPNEGKPPTTWKLALVKWFGLFPPLVMLSYGFNFLSTNFLSTDWWFVRADGTLVLWVKLLCETVILVPFLNFVLTPWLDDVFADFLYD